MYSSEFNEIFLCVVEQHLGERLREQNREGKIRAGRPLTLFCKAPRGTWGLKGNSLL